MFDNDNHSTGEALEKYKKLDGKEGLLSYLKTSTEHGIASGDPNLMTERIDTYGTNAARPMKVKGLCTLIKEQLDDTTMKILIVATIISLSIGIWRDLQAYYGHNKVVLFLLETF